MNAMKSFEERYPEAIKWLANKYQDPTCAFDDIDDSYFREAVSRICTTFNKLRFEVIDDLCAARHKALKSNAEDEAIRYQQLDEYGDDKPTSSND